MDNLHKIAQEESTRVEFLKRIIKTETCWNWSGTITSHGYGHFKKNQKLYRAHRLSYVLFKGEITSGLLVCHSCDNKKCVNPDHLWLGTSSDNSKDMSLKGRGVGNRINHYSGESHHRRVLTREIIAKIHELKEKHSQREMSEMFGVSQSSVSNAVRGLYTIPNLYSE